MRHSFHLSVLISLGVVGLLTVSAHAQSFARLAQDQWNGSDFVVTFDHPLTENAGHVKDSDDRESAEMWDSYGRIRTSRTDDNAPFVAYRIFTSNVDTPSPIIHPTMDDFELAVGLHIGEYKGWKIDTLLGAGYSGVHPFLNEKGIFGIGDITATHNITDNTSVLLGVDYAGNNGLLPDVPLPGFGIIHREDHFDVMLGFPVNRIVWRPRSDLTVTAQYTVPYTANLDMEYIPFKHVGFYGYAGNFFQGFNNAREGVTDRQFFQMRSVEAGMRFIFAPLGRRIGRRWLRLRPILQQRLRRA